MTVDGDEPAPMAGSDSAGANDSALAVTVAVRDRSQVVKLLHDTAAFLSGSGRAILEDPGDTEFVMRRVDSGDFVIVRIKTG